MISSPVITIPITSQIIFKSLPFWLEKEDPLVFFHFGSGAD
jgi:hypothetical protein